MAYSRGCAMEELRRRVGAAQHSVGTAAHPEPHPDVTRGDALCVAHLVHPLTLRVLGDELAHRLLLACGAIPHFSPSAPVVSSRALVAVVETALDGAPPAAVLAREAARLVRERGVVPPGAGEPLVRFGDVCDFVAGVLSSPQARFSRPPCTDTVPIPAMAAAYIEGVVGALLPSLATAPPSLPPPLEHGQPTPVAGDGGTGGEAPAPATGGSDGGEVGAPLQARAPLVPPSLQLVRGDPVAVRAGASAVLAARLASALRRGCGSTSSGWPPMTATGSPPVFLPGTVLRVRRGGGGGGGDGRPPGGDVCVFDVLLRGGMEVEGLCARDVAMRPAVERVVGRRSSRRVPCKVPPAREGQPQPTTGGPGDNAPSHRVAGGGDAGAAPELQPLRVDSPGGGSGPPSVHSEAPCCAPPIVVAPSPTRHSPAPHDDLRSAFPISAAPGCTADAASCGSVTQHLSSPPTSPWSEGELDSDDVPGGNDSASSHRHHTSASASDEEEEEEGGDEAAVLQGVDMQGRPLGVGDRVEARYRGRGATWYTGTVTAVHPPPTPRTEGGGSTAEACVVGVVAGSTFTLLYDDGDRERGAESSAVRLLPPPPPPHGGAALPPGAGAGWGGEEHAGEQQPAEREPDEEGEGASLASSSFDLGGAGVEPSSPESPRDDAAAPEAEADDASATFPLPSALLLAALNGGAAAGRTVAVETAPRGEHEAGATSPSRGSGFSSGGSASSDVSGTRTSGSTGEASPSSSSAPADDVSQADNHQSPPASLLLQWEGHGGGGPPRRRRSSATSAHGGVRGSGGGHEPPLAPGDAVLVAPPDGGAWGDDGGDGGGAGEEAVVTRVAGDGRVSVRFAGGRHAFGLPGARVRRASGGS